MSSVWENPSLLVFSFIFIFIPSEYADLGDEDPDEEKDEEIGRGNPSPRTLKKEAPAETDIQMPAPTGA